MFHLHYGMDLFYLMKLEGKGGVTAYMLHNNSGRYPIIQSADYEGWEDREKERKEND